MRHVAIVDDSPDVRALWRAELEASGEFSVCAEGNDGREAAEIALELRPDIMLLDLSMPGLGGLQAIPLVLEASPGTQVVVLTAMGRNQFSSAALSLGATAFLEKHLPSGSLVSRLHEALGARTDAHDTEVPLVVTVEPDGNHRSLLHYLLDWLGCRTVQAHSGQKALEALAGTRADLVLVSNALPDMTAAEFGARLRRQEGRGRRAPLVVLGDGPMGEHADGAIPKPVSAENLQALLARWAPTGGEPEPEPLVQDEYLSALTERIGGAALEEILAGFRVATRERLTHLREAVDAGDAETVALLAHQIRGSARSLAAPRLASAAKNLERLADEGSTSELREHAGRLQLMFDDTDAAIAAIVSIPMQRTDPDPLPEATAGRAPRWRLGSRQN
ncbi:MAG: response regulator [Sporichthyaceae bacterium]